MNDVFYAGVGSRETPLNICNRMTLLAQYMEKEGIILRSGGAKGADTAFEEGVSDPANKEIFYKEDACADALYIASQFHPNWKACGKTARTLHARNVYQVLGRDFNSPVSAVFCWTPDGSTGEYTSRKTGGTGTAIRIAYARGIPIFNFGSCDRTIYYEVLKECLEAKQKA